LQLGSEHRRAHGEASVAGSLDDRFDGAHLDTDVAPGTGCDELDFGEGARRPEVAVGNHFPLGSLGNFLREATQRLAKKLSPVSILSGYELPGARPLHGQPQAAYDIA
jgi:hypothetical protein